MRFRYVVASAIVTFLVVVLVSCGGGGSAMGVLSIIPKGDYNAIMGGNPSVKYNSPIFKDIADEVRSIEDQAEKWEDSVEDMGLDNPMACNLILVVQSEDSRENVSFMAGRYDPDDLEDFYEDELNLQDWDDDERNNKTYYTGTIGGTEYGALLERGGVIFGQVDTIEDVIDVLTEGDKSMTRDDDFIEARGLVDFNATEFELHWENIDAKISEFKRLIQQVDDEEDLLDAIDDLRGVGYSYYWSNRIRIVLKFMFKDEDAVETLFEFLQDDMDEAFEEIGPGLVTRIFGADANTDDLDELADLARMNRRGNILEVTMEFDWKILEEIVD
jgi:hypothetical protein